MDRRPQLDGINSFLSETYGPLTDFPALLGALGFTREQAASLCRDHLDTLLDEFVGLVGARLTMAHAAGTRLFRIVSRRHAFDGEPTAILEELGAEFGLSRERIRQLQQKALRSCGGRSHRQFVEDGLQRCAERFVGPARQPWAGDESIDPITRPPVVAQMTSATPPLLVRREPSAPDPDDIEFVASLIAVILGQLPDGLSVGMLTHILAGSSGPVVDAVVHHYGLRQYAMLQGLGFARVKELVRVACDVDARFVRLNGRVGLASERRGYATAPAAERPRRALAEATAAFVAGDG